MLSGEMLSHAGHQCAVVTVIIAIIDVNICACTLVVVAAGKPATAEFYA